MNKELFKKRVYEKYNENKYNRKNEFYNNHYFNNKYKSKYKFSRIAASVIISCFATASMVYAGIITYNYYQQKTKTDFENNINYDYSQDMEYQNGIYYKEVTSYDEFNIYKQRWNNLVNMNDEEFDRYFIIIIATENTSMIGLTVSNITTDDTTLYVELFQDTKSADMENSVISIKVPIEEYRNNIIFKKIGYKPEASQYVSLSELPKTYSKEQAIEDNCFVIENGKIISLNKEQLNEFIENSKGNKESYIRIVKYNNDGLSNGCTITDVEYKENRYYICSDTTRLINEDEYNHREITYHEGTKIFQSRKKDTNNISIYVQDDYGNQYTICNIY